MLWEYNGCQPHSPLAQELRRLKMKRKLAIDLMKQKVRESIAIAMATDFSDSTHFDRSRAWKPVRSVLKGKSGSCSSIIENNRKSRDILNFWKKHYSEKLKATNGHIPTSKDSAEFLKVSEQSSENVYITTEHAMKALDAMNFSILR